MIMMKKFSLTGGNVILAACTVSAASLALTAMSTYIYDPMATDFGLSGDEAVNVKLIPTIATILVVFLAGSLGDRIGRRRVVAWGATAFWVGALITTISPVVGVAVLGLSIIGAGASTMGVVALSILGSAFTSKDDRAHAFSVLGMMTPAVFLIAPFVAGFLVTESSWRVVTATWILIGWAAFVLAAKMLPADEVQRSRAELITPLLAGMALAVLVQVPNAVSNGRPTWFVVSSVSFAIVCVIALVVVYRRMRNPTLNFRPLRSWRSWLLLFVVVTIPIASIWYTAYLAFEYLYGFSAVQISIVMIPAQLAGIVGARFMNGLISKRGLLVSGVVTMTCLVIVEFAYLLVNEESMWLSIVLITGYGMTSTAVTVVMSNSVMNAASSAESGAMSSYRSAASRVGAALGTLIIGGVLFGAYNADLSSLESTSQYETSSIPSSQQAIYETESMVGSLHARAILGGCVTIIGLGVFTVAMRRRTSPSTDESGVGAGAAA